jgi:hypothetical protein
MEQAVRIWPLQVAGDRVYSDKGRREKRAVR